MACAVRNQLRRDGLSSERLSSERLSDGLSSGSNWLHGNNLPRNNWPDSSSSSGGGSSSGYWLRLVSTDETGNEGIDAGGAAAAFKGDPAVATRVGIEANDGGIVADGKLVAEGVVELSLDLDEDGIRTRGGDAVGDGEKLAAVRAGYTKRKRERNEADAHLRR